MYGYRFSVLCGKFRDRVSVFIFEHTVRTDAEGCKNKLGAFKLLGKKGLYNIIKKPSAGTGQNVNVPEYSGHSEFILILEVGSVAPF